MTAFDICMFIGHDQTETQKFRKLSSRALTDAASEE
jgi:hypothetical protein